MFRYMKNVLKFAGESSSRIIISFIPSFLKIMAAQMMVFYAYWMIMKIVKGEYVPEDSLKAALAIVVTLLLEMVFENIYDRLASSAGFIIMARKRKELGEHLRRLPMGYFTEGNIGNISTVLATDMTFIEETGIGSISVVVADISSIIIMGIFLIFLDFRLALIYGATILLTGIVGTGLIRVTKNESDIRQEQNQTLASNVIEFVEGIGLVKAFNYSGDRYNSVLDAFHDSSAKNIGYEEKYTPWSLAVNCICALATTAVAGMGIYLYRNNSMSADYLLGMLIFVFQLFVPLKTYYAEMTVMGLVQSSIDRINALLEVKELSDEGTEKLPQNAKYEIEASGISFGYDENEVIHDVSFQVKKGEMLALVGPSGGGKSTIASLIARLWDVDSGSVMLRGKDIRSIPFSSLMDHISMVFQRVYLFNDTIYNNISMGRPDASFEEVVSAAKKARCYDFIMSLPDGFQTVVGEGGSSLSGGEKQRISIARCILKDAPIIILDEATASVDVDNEAFIEEAISELCKNKTIVVIAHRLNTIVNADKILVVKDGCVAESGNHSSLMKLDGIYKSMVDSRQNLTGWKTD